LKTISNIALVGNPNCGKSSLFNSLTGLNQKVGNFPGVTVEKKSGKCKLDDGTQVSIIDLPGTYSLYPKSADELVTYDVLFDDDAAVNIDVVIALADASNLKRNLLFCSQILDLKKPTIIALTMMDIARNKGIKINIEQLERELGIPVVVINPRKGKGMQELKKQITRTLLAKPNLSKPDFIDNYSIAKTAIDCVKKQLPNVTNYEAVHIASEIKEINFLSAQVKNNIQQSLGDINYSKTKIQAQEIIQRYAVIKKIMNTCVIEVDPLQKERWSEQLDKYLLHPVYGYLFLLIVLFVLFQSIFWLSQFPMNWIDIGFGNLIQLLRNNLADNWFTDLLLNGVLAGINGILIFVPQIMILFGLITIIEDTGYMSRISFLTDRLMRSVGLNGKSVMPLISSMACAVPAIMSARTIENKKERLITILITPLMSCSARLPVYTILIGLVIPNKNYFGIFNLQGLVMMLLYLFGFVMSLLVAYILQLFIKIKERSIFLMELPIYKAPRWKNAFQTMLQKAKVFVFDAGKIIFVLSIILWFLSSYGFKNNVNTAPNFIQKTSLENSMAGSLGKSIEPAIKPLGFDWKIGIALITSFVAREVFVGTMSTLYSVDNEDDVVTLQQKMSNATTVEGTKIFTLKTGMALLLFYAIALQCMSTLSIVKRETGSWKYPIIQFIAFGMIAYLFAFIAQIVF
jgi:ferrous iron transport protein B